uniref:Uncharacterized protein n=1 Tax=Opuntia streptacantha TaxID=393608 RepID=A0A7C9AD31_OPUST
MYSSSSSVNPTNWYLRARSTLSSFCSKSSTSPVRFMCHFLGITKCSHIFVRSLTTRMYCSAKAAALVYSGKSACTVHNDSLQHLKALSTSLVHPNFTSCHKLFTESRINFTEPRTYAEASGWPSVAGRAASLGPDFDSTSEPQSPP